MKRVFSSYNQTAVYHAQNLLNNAGINRDRMFASMTEQDWDAIMAVHLKGHFCITSHAVHYWRGQSKEGKPVDARIINTTSGAGLQGSIGQSNYAAAKAGIAALTLNQAAELARYNITANAVAPSARTGMTSAVPEMAARMAAVTSARGKSDSTTICISDSAS